MSSSMFLRVVRATRSMPNKRITAAPKSVLNTIQPSLPLTVSAHYRLLQNAVRTLDTRVPDVVGPSIERLFPRQHRSFDFYHPALTREQTNQNALLLLATARDHDSQNGKGSRQRRHFGSSDISALSSRPRQRRVVHTGRLRAGVEKQRSTLKRNYASSTNSSNAEQKRVTWREALESPRKAVTFASQLCRSLIDWVKHMWAGVKLLAADVRVSSKVVKKITQGKQISRRERNFIVKTGVDLARLVPFSLFLIIPLAEFALPFALRLFPNMLPSQFQDQMQAEEKLKRRLKGRLELAKYLRDVVEEKAKTIKASDANSDLKKEAEALTSFLDAIRSGKEVDVSEVGRFARFFVDELTIDGAVRPQLVAMCKYMGISPYGNDIFLRFKLRSRLSAIKKDDMEIMWEGGPDSLTDDEVAKACRDRGIKEVGSMQRMRQQLGDWLDLSQKREIPGSLLIMSRALLYTRPDGKIEEGSEGLVETLGSLPDDVIMDVKKSADVGEGSNVERLEETLRQATLIEIESEREARKEKEDEEKRRKKEAEDATEAMPEEVELAMPSVSVQDENISDKDVREKVELEEAKLAEDILSASDQGAGVNTDDTEKSEEEAPEAEAKDEEELHKERDGIRSMLLSLEELSSDSAVEREREELRNLKLELAEAEALVKGTEGEDSTDMRRFKSLVRRLEREIERVDAKVGLRMKLLDHDNDGLISLHECKSVITLIAGDRDDDLVAETLERLDADADGNISKDDLARVLREIQFEHGVSEETSQSKT